MDSLLKTLATAAESADVKTGLEALIALDPIGALREINANAVDLRARLGAETFAELASASAIRSAGRAPDSVEFIRACLPLVDLLSADAVVGLLRAFPRDDPARDMDTLIGQLQAHHMQHPAVLELVARRAVERGLPEASDLLNRLGRADPRQMTVDRVLRLRARIAVDPGRRGARIALLSSFTIDPVVGWLDLELRELGLAPAVRVSPFNSWAQELVDRHSDLTGFAPDVIFLAVSIEDLVPSLAGDPTAAELTVSGREAVDRVLAPIRSFRAHSTIPVVVHSFHTALVGGLAARGGLGQWLAQLDADLSAGLQGLESTYLLDMTQLLIRRTAGRADHPKLRHLGALRLSSEVAAEVARAYAGFVAPIMGLARKCVVLDLDNTLWGGTVGEDGPEGIRLGDSSPGVEYKDFQRYLKGLGATGFLLAVCSKNNPDDALEVLRNNPHMLLREEDFSSIQINWDPKPENLRRIAAELEIGTDSLVFVDDNPAEREQVRQALPEVLVPELPRDPALYREQLAGLPQLQRLQVTDEDRDRGEMYRAQRERRSALESFKSTDDYLRSLDITVQIGPAERSDLARIHQLVERTNQFNLTTRRYSASELSDLAHGSGRRLYVARARDRFGDHGMISVAIIGRTRAEWRIETFLMSCRVIGYGVETALLAVISEDAVSEGVADLLGELIPSRKNMPARDFYLRHGFVHMHEVGDVSVFRRQLGAPVPRPTWIAIEIERAHEN